MLRQDIRARRATPERPAVKKSMDRWEWLGILAGMLLNLIGLLVAGTIELVGLLLAPGLFVD